MSPGPAARGGWVVGRRSERGNHLGKRTLCGRAALAERNVLVHFHLHLRFFQFSIRRQTHQFSRCADPGPCSFSQRSRVDITSLLLLCFRRSQLSRLAPSRSVRSLLSSSSSSRPATVAVESARSAASCDGTPPGIAPLLSAIALLKSTLSQLKVTPLPSYPGASSFASVTYL